MKNWSRRALRTFGQAAVGYIAIALPTVDFTVGGTVLKTVALGVGMSAISAGLAAIMNLNEEE